MEVNVTKSENRPTFVPDVVEDIAPAAGSIPEPQLTEAEFEKLRTDALQSMGYQKPTEEFLEARRVARAARDAEEPVEEPAAAAAPAAAQPAPPAAPIPPAPPARPAPPVIDTAAMERAVERGVRAASAQPPTPVVPAADPLQGFTDDEREDIDVARWVEAKNPTKFKGLADKFIAFTKALSIYQAKFRTDNPGEAYNPDDSQHDDFYQTHNPGITSEEMDKLRIRKTAAEAAIEETKIQNEDVRRRQSEADARENRRERQDREIELGRTARASVYGLIKDLIHNVDPEALKILSDSQGRMVANDALMQKLNEYDPFIHAQLRRAVNIIGLSVAEVWKLYDPKMNRLGYSFDPLTGKTATDTQKAHAFISEVASAREQKLLSGPLEGRLKDGREYIPTRKWIALNTAAAGDQARIDDIKAAYWTFEVKDLENIIRDSLIDEIKAKISEMELFSSGRARRAPGAQVVIQRQPAIPALPSIERERRRAPSTSSATDVVAVPGANGSGAKSLADIVVDTAFPR